MAPGQLLIFAAMFVAGFIFLATILIFPLAAFVHCLLNPRLSVGAKIVWACLILFTWTLGASLYGINASQKTLFQLLGFLALTLLIAALLVRKPLAGYVARERQATVLRSLDKIQLGDLGEVDRAILKDEIARLDVSKEGAGALLKRFDDLMGHGHLDRDHLMEWQHSYQTQTAPADSKKKK